MDGPGTQDQQVVARRQLVRDLGDKSVQVLEAVRLAGGLRDATAAMANERVMPDVARGFVVGRHVGLHPRETCETIRPADHQGLTRIDPD